MSRNMAKLATCFSKYFGTRRWSKKKFVVGFICLVIVMYVLPNIGGGIYVKRRYDMSTYYQPCQLPKLNPYDPEVMRSFKKHPPVECDKMPRIVYADVNSEMHFNNTAMAILNLKEKSVECTCSLISRSGGDSYVTLGLAIPCTPPATVDSDFFQIQCFSDKKVVMDDLLTKINANKEKIQRTPTKNEYSLLMFGLDSVARNMAIRTIPKTFKYITETLGGYDMKNYMKVGDNTYPNLVALLTGRFFNNGELSKEYCFNDVCDNMPLIWRNFSEKGYVTFFAEDNFRLNTFNHGKHGFYRQPTDHYMRPFWMTIEKLHPERVVAEFMLRKNILTGLVSATNIEDPFPGCLGNITKYMIQTNYLKQFVHTYRNTPYFALSFITELAHSDQNYLTVADDDLLKFLQWLKQGGYLDNTILILFSDHGSRSYQFTHTIRMENSLPLLNIVIPDRLKADFPNTAQNLETNRNRLTSTFDLHATLRTILGGDFDEPSYFKVGDKIRGISMFGEIPDQRSCAEANIPDHFCVCYKTEAVNITSDKLVPKIADALVAEINKLMKNAPECAVLSLHKVVEARIMSEALKLDHLIKKSVWSKAEVVPQTPDSYKRYNIVVETVPGHGRFHGTVHVNKNGDMTVAKEFDRTNLYGTQSHCMNDQVLRAYCYCKEQLP